MRGECDLKPNSLNALNSYDHSTGERKFQPHIYLGSHLKPLPRQPQHMRGELRRRRGSAREEPRCREDSIHHATVEREVIEISMSCYLPHPSQSPTLLQRLLRRGITQHPNTLQSHAAGRSLASPSPTMLHHQTLLPFCHGSFYLCNSRHGRRYKPMALRGDNQLGSFGATSIEGTARCLGLHFKISFNALSSYHVRKEYAL